MKSQFLDELDARNIDDQTDMLLAQFRYQSKLLGVVVEAPKGFVTDYASVPRLPILYALAGGKAKKSAVIHDYLYQHHTVGKRKADLVFLEAMKVQGINYFLREMMYAGVMVGGWTSYATGPDRFKVLQAKK